MKVIVTGAAGKLGRHVVRELVAAGHEVVGLDRKIFRTVFRCRQIDLLNGPRVVAALAGAEAVVHLANHPERTKRLPDPIFAENVAMNFNVFEAARIAATRLIVFASSIQVTRGERQRTDAAVRSPLPWLPLDGALPAMPANPYALSKSLGEEQLRYYVRNTGLTAVALRFPMLVAEPPALTDRLLRNPPLDEAFTWLTHADAARAIQAVLAAPLQGFRTYFAAASRPRINENVEILRQRFFSGVPVKAPLPLASFVDCSALLRDTGWAPRDL
ncbi:MAG: NAD(P)-dependent oxidoreductase [Opitutaceae bacterium]|nr:NAD(P)-dependent oxidoreductase [Opitutaceae bacterium]